MFLKGILRMYRKDKDEDVSENVTMTTKSSCNHTFYLLTGFKKEPN